MITTKRLVVTFLTCYGSNLASTVEAQVISTDTTEYDLIA